MLLILKMLLLHIYFYLNAFRLNKQMQNFLFLFYQVP
jgi:hypothetical protein